MKKDMIFFSENGQGLTSTSANHVANMAKEMVRNIQSSLQNIVMYSTEVSLIDSDSSNLLRQGANDQRIIAVNSDIYRIAKANALIAWLREAIKARERMLKEAEEMSIDDFAKLQNINLEKEPEMETALNEDDYYASLSVAERNRYYELEALAAVLGKEIHPGGSFADAREALNMRIEQPHDVKGEGRDTLIYTYTPSTSTTLVEDTYFNLQRHYREAQAALNSIKYSCRKAVTESLVKVRTDYAKAMSEYTEHRKVVEAQRAEYVQKRVKEIANYKILIPEALADIYNQVAHLGKKQ